MHAEQPERTGHNPVNQRRLFNKRNAIQAGRNVVARCEHIARNLRLDGVHVVHESWRTDYTYKKDEGCCSEHNPAASKTGRASEAFQLLLAVISNSLVEYFLKIDNPVNPHCSALLSPMKSAPKLGAAMSPQIDIMSTLCKEMLSNHNSRKSSY